MNERENYTFKDYIEDFELKLLDENDQKIVINMLKARNLSDFKFSSKPSFSSPTDVAIQLAQYTQNYLILKQLTEINDSNKSITEQNKQIIELLTKISEK